MEASEIIHNDLVLEEGIWCAQISGNWSLVEQRIEQKILADLSECGCREAIHKNCPQFEDLTFSLKRAAGVGILEFQESDIVVDVGCNWGALSVPIARTNCKVIGIDQTKESLLFLRKRLEEEGLTNVGLVCIDIQDLSFRKASVDKFIVNGVLEWIPEAINVAFEKDRLQKSKKKNIVREIFRYYKENQSPIEIQRKFLGKLNKALKRDGVLYLAIENRFDIQFFLGGRDPHTGLRFVNILPRIIQIPYSFFMSGRPFQTWIYSENEIRRLLYSSGFSDVELMYAFPNYHFPDLVLSAESMKKFRPVRFIKSRRKHIKIIWWFLETVFYKLLKAKRLSPAFIVIARK
jgi:2-polyprenyl-3-methyl-5-hydroxy-6-metoxy-1,4-benzoquinol methylase